MKTSPLQLNWVAYRKAGFEAQQHEARPDTPPPLIEATVIFNKDGDHTAWLSVKSDEAGASHAYTFDVEVVATFAIDLALAIQAYKPTNMNSLPGTIATNLARVLYAGVREYLATITARGPWSSILLPSVMLEPSDVRVGWVPDSAEVMRLAFGAAEGDLFDAAPIAHDAQG